ncbi:hypothetical protein SDC9_184309 [bioreactor metagenome]|uniref:Uncharacterized protein n=1 Tax=bioreactor metagenome TaxID=1076179 RepID=A0A645HCN8_9ZZZZ
MPGTRQQGVSNNIYKQISKVGVAISNQALLWSSVILPWFAALYEKGKTEKLYIEGGGVGH